MWRVARTTSALTPSSPTTTCRNRHCPKCQGAAAQQWLAEREADLLPVGYFHVVFTLPAAVADIAYQNKAAIYDILFTASAETMIAIAADPKHLGARIGITAVLHTWGSAMTHHPHVHMIVPGGGITTDGSRWVSCRPNFFLPVKVLSRLFRGLVLAKLRSAHQAGRLKFFGGHAHLDDARAFKAYLAPLRNIEWVVYAKRPFGGPQAVLAYLSRYTHRIAISNHRLISADETGVTFKWKDYRIEGPGRYKTMSLDTPEFIRRFLIHVLPKGFHRIRHYGLLASANRAANIAHARKLLAVPSAEPDTTRDAAKRRSTNSAAAASMSLLRWPHDRHRDLRARLRAEAPASTTSGANQDRHLMMNVTADRRQLRPLPSPLARRRPRPNLHPSSGLARVGVANPVGQRADRSFTPMRSSWVCSKPTAAAASVQPLQAQPRG